MIRALWAKAFPVRVYHHRANGPVVIDPSRHYVVIVVGRAR